MKKYELMILFKPLLPEDTKEGLQKQVHDIITHKKIGGKIIETDVWGKRHLAYPVNDYDEGYYIVYQVELNPNKNIEMEKMMRLNEDILRYLLIAEEEL